MGRRGGGDVPAGSSPAVGTKRTDGLAGAVVPSLAPADRGSHIRSSAWSVSPRDGSRRQGRQRPRSEEHTSELQSLMRISYAVFCLNKKNNYHRDKRTTT